MNHFYNLKDGDCYKWIFRQSRFLNGKREVAPQGHPFIIPVEEVDVIIVILVNNSSENDFLSNVPPLLFFKIVL